MGPRAALAGVGAVAVAAGSRRERHRAGRRRLARRNAERGRGDDRRPDPGVARADGTRSRTRRSAARAPTFANSFTNWPLLLPVAGDLPHRPVRAQPRRARQPAPDGGFDRLDDAETLPVWLQRAGYYTTHIGKYLNGYGDNAVGVPPGLDGVARAKRTTASARAAEDGQRRHLRLNRRDPDNPAPPPTELKQDVFTDIAVERSTSAPAAGRSSSGSSTRRPTAAARTRAPNRRPAAQGSAKPAVRHSGAFDTEPLPQPPNFNEADVSDKPAAIAEPRPLITERDRQRDPAHYRCRIESLLSVDDGVERIVDALARRRRARRHADRLHLRQRLLPRRAPGPDGKNRVYEEAVRVPLVIRGPGVPRRASRSTTWRSTPTSRRRSSTPPAPTPGLPGRSLAAAASPSTPSACAAASC